MLAKLELEEEKRLANEVSVGGEDAMEEEKKEGGKEL